MFAIQGHKKGAETPRVAREDPDSLISFQVARIIDLLGEGEIEGLVDGAKSIYFDKTPLQNPDNSFNFEGVSFEEKKGTQAQTRLKGIPGTENTINVSTEVTNGTSIVRTVTDPDVDFVRVAIRIPALTRQDKTNGDLHGYSVTIGIDVQNNGGGYVRQITQTIRGKTTSPYFRDFYVPLTAGGDPWDIRVVRDSADESASHIQNATWWDSYTEVKEEKFTFPNSALVRLTVDSSQFSAIPTRGYEVKGLKVKIPTGYDPVARTYTDPWDGTFTTAWTDNPAWCFYDLATNPRYGLGEVLPESFISKFDLYTISKYCDTMVDDGNGGTEPRFTCNVVLVSPMEAYKALIHLASVFRGMPYWTGSALTAVQDSPATPVYQFNNTNVIDGIFHYSGTERSARHTAALVTWNDPSDQYRQKVEFVPGDATQISRWGYKPLNMHAVGCTSQGQAHRAGKFALITNTTEDETVVFRTSYESARVFPGAIIQIQDRDRAGKQWGGRVKGTSTTTSIVLDRSVTLEVGRTYTLHLLDVNGGVESQAVLDGAGDYTTLTTNAFATAPQENSVWVLSADNLALTKWRVLRIRERGKNIWEIEALKHNENKHAETESDLVFEATPTTLIPSTLAAPTSIQDATKIVNVQGEMRLALMLSWQSVNAAVSWTVIYRKLEENAIGLPRTHQPFVEILDLEPGTYDITVVAHSASGLASPPATKQVTVTGLEGQTAMPNVRGIEIYGQGNDTDFSGRDVKIVWRRRSETSSFGFGTEPEEEGANAGALDPYFSHYLVEVYNEAGTKLQDYKTTDSWFDYTYDKNLRDGGPNRTLTFKVYEVGKQNQISPTPAELTVNNPAPQLPTGVSLSNGVYTLQLKYNEPADPDYAGMMVWISENPSFAPSGTSPINGNCVYRGTDRLIVVDVKPNTTYYVRYAAFDVYTDEISKLNLSSEFTIQTTQVVAGDIADDAITQTKITDGSISTPKLAANAVTAAKIAANTITANEIASNTITAGQIAADTITSAEIAAGAISANEIAAGTITADKYNEIRNSVPMPFSDSLDSSHPAVFDFPITSETTTIVKVFLSFKIRQFRAYATTTASGGSSTPTTSSGGATTPTSAGGTTPLHFHAHPVPMSNGAASNPITFTSGNLRCSGGGTIVIGDHKYSLVNGTGGSQVYVNGSSGGLACSGGGSFTVDTQDGHNHTVSLQNATASGSNACHLMNGMVVGLSVPGQIVTNSAGSGTSAHTHQVTIPNHTHTVTIGNHNHALTYGIFEDSTSPTIDVYLSDNGGASYNPKFGTYTTDQLELDVTSELSGTGWKAVKFETNANARIAAVVQTKLDISA